MDMGKQMPITKLPTILFANNKFYCAIKTKCKPWSFAT